MRPSIKAALVGGVLLVAGASGAMAGWGDVYAGPAYYGYGYGAPAALGVLPALAPPPVGYVVETQCARRHFVTDFGRVVSHRVCYPVQAW